jgi:hypothetical protein
VFLEWRPYGAGVRRETVQVDGDRQDHQAGGQDVTADIVG